MAAAVNWYDFPAFYDLAFRDETPEEVKFLTRAAQRYAVGPVRSFLEAGCGSGRLLVALARLGYRVAGFDCNRQMLDYAARRLCRQDLAAKLFEADLADFRLSRPVDVAYCTFSTFRHLLSEAAARRSLECMATAVRPGGICILGLHLLPPDAADESEERWRASHGRTRLHATLKVVHADRRRRLERLRLSLRVRSPRRDVRMRSEFDLRTYTPRQFRKVLDRASAFELQDVFDFWYELDRPQQLDDQRVDTVVVLRRR